ncbi:helix-turn-helix domain-containing protein [Thalassospira xiamenensis]|uniref:Helix-turn-helix n=1 Tax=Thalassospira xiamenensis TaxID=220697 RepID=A0A285TXU0_9PROT|nr:helix-turn-helix transcriptional regulator [Thalassospira xiamenensis]SOC30541.1 Helix-turn-helix [Thalassospira xiamenensis]
MRSKTKITKSGVVHPRIDQAFKKLGEDISYARRARRMSVEEFSDRVGISRATLYRLEKGDPGISVATLAMALHVLGRLTALKDIVDVASDHIGLMQMKDEVPRRINRKGSGKGRGADKREHVQSESSGSLEYQGF